MSDAGQNGDVRRADGLFTAVVPAEVQKHRRLVRYVVIISGKNAVTIRAPVATNACPNFAWFVSDGVAPWKGSSKPGSKPALNFSPEFLTTLPVYHLIARGSDVERSQWDSG